MSWSDMFSFMTRGSESDELPDIYPFPMIEGDFVTTDVVNIYSRILTDVLERTDGIAEENQTMLWDNCLGSEMQDGLVTLLAKAMTDKKDLFLVVNKTLKVIKKADEIEQEQIRADYMKKGESSTGVYITFKNYKRTDFVKLYSALEYCTVASLHKNMNLSKAIQLKIKSLRAGVGLIDAEKATSQGKAVANHLAAGKNVMLDSEDSIETATPDLTATNSSMDFIAQKQSFYLGLPVSWITGAVAKSMSDSGQADQRAVERGLRGYYFAIIKPVIKACFGNETTFKSEDFDMLDTALQALTTFEATSNEIVSLENKTRIQNKLLGLPENAKGDPPEEIETDPNAVQEIDPRTGKPIPKPPKAVPDPAAAG